MTEKKIVQLKFSFNEGESCVHCRHLTESNECKVCRKKISAPEKTQCDYWLEKN